MLAQLPNRLIVFWYVQKFEVVSHRADILGNPCKMAAYDLIHRPIHHTDRPEDRCEITHLNVTAQHTSEQQKQNAAVPQQSNHTQS